MVKFIESFQKIHGLYGYLATCCPRSDLQEMTFHLQLELKNRLSTSNLMLKIIEEIWPESPDYNKTVLTKLFTTFLSSILTFIYLYLTQIKYIQKNGCAMGTVCTPSYTNLIMAPFQEKHTYPYIKDLFFISKIYRWHIYHMERNKRIINNIYLRTE